MQLASNMVRLNLIRDTKKVIRIRSFIVTGDVAAQAERELKSGLFVGIEYNINHDPSKRNRFDQINASVNDILLVAKELLK